MNSLRRFLPVFVAASLLCACGRGIPPVAGTAAEVRPDVLGWGPADIQAAYNLPSASRGSGQIVAVVSAFDNPKVASDLDSYRSHFGLPRANFTKYNQEGQRGNYPRGDEYVGFETDLDVEMVSASCPNCTIYLVEADDFQTANFEAAEIEAVKLGAHIVSNSWSCYCSKSAFETPHVVYVAASGDYGYTEEPPAAFGSVVAVGGTILAKSGSRYKEIVWPDTAGGCAHNFNKPPWQHDPKCKSRTENDVAAVATDLAEYDSYGNYGWTINGGTSASAPIIAGVYGLAENAASQHAGKKLWTLTPQERRRDLHYISRGSDGGCGGSYLCTAGTRQFGTYSGPAGWGTPNGIGAF